MISYLASSAAFRPSALQRVSRVGTRHAAASSFSTSASKPPHRLLSSAVPSTSHDYSGERQSVGQFEKIACIGTGKMAEAILQPVIENGVQPANKISVFDVSSDAMDHASESFGVQTSTSIPELVDGADLVLCCVKPQNLTDEFFGELQKGNPREDSIFLSILAGKSISELQKSGFPKVVRSMPNTPAMIGQGMTVWSCTENLTSTERKKIRSVLSSCGKSVCGILERRLTVSWYMRQPVLFFSNSFFLLSPSDVC